MNAICERFLGSLRRECLDHILVLDDRHFHRVVTEYVRYHTRRSQSRDPASHWNPRKEDDVRTLLAELGLGALVEEGASAQHLLRTVFGREFVADEEFRLLDLDREAKMVFASLETKLERPGRVWELISAVIDNAGAEQPKEATPRLRALLAAYRRAFGRGPDAAPACR
jgi:hypothetical protein